MACSPTTAGNSYRGDAPPCFSPQQLLHDSARELANRYRACRPNSSLAGPELEVAAQLLACRMHSRPVTDIASAGQALRALVSDATRSNAAVVCSTLQMQVGLIESPPLDRVAKLLVRHGLLHLGITEIVELHSELQRRERLPSIAPTIGDGSSSIRPQQQSPDVGYYVAALAMLARHGAVSLAKKSSPVLRDLCRAAAMDREQLLRSAEALIQALDSDKSDKSDKDDKKENENENENKKLGNAGRALSPATKLAVSWIERPRQSLLDRESYSSSRRGGQSPLSLQTET